MPADMVQRAGRRVPDNGDRGLMMLAWKGGRPVQCVSRGEYIGMTPMEVAGVLGLSVDEVRAKLLDGEIPSARTRRGRPLGDEALRRRRRAGVPEHLLHETVPTIARELGVSQGQVSSAIYRNGQALR